jgi:hypothetical protein
MKYQHDIFYNSSELSKNQIRKLFKEAHGLCFNWWVDKHPEGTRIKVEWPFEKIIRLFDRTTRKHLHITIIHRRGYENWKHYLEIGFCTMGRNGKDGDMFLWIEVDLEHKDNLLQKYGILNTL